MTYEWDIPCKTCGGKVNLYNYLMGKPCPPGQENRICRACDFGESECTCKPEK